MRTGVGAGADADDSWGWVSRKIVRARDEL